MKQILGNIANTPIKKVLLIIVVLLFVMLTVAVVWLSISNWNKQRELDKVGIEKMEALDNVRKEAEASMVIRLDSIASLESALIKKNEELAYSIALTEYLEQQQRDNDEYIKKLRGDTSAILAELHSIESKLHNKAQ